MKYNLTNTQSYDTTELQAAFDLASVQAYVSGHGENSLAIHGDTVNAEPIVQIHINEMTPSARAAWRADQVHNANVQRELEQINISALTEILEFVAGLPSAPQTLKNRAAEALAKRGELRP